MTYGNARSGPNNVGEYQTSGLPWVSSSSVTTAPFKIDFPYVTNGISLHVTGGTVGLRLGFTLNGVNGSNFITITNTDGWSHMPIRCKSVFIRSETGTVPFSLLASLTLIEEKVFPVLTGSAIYLAGSTGSFYGYGKPGDPGVGSGLG